MTLGPATPPPMAIPIVGKLPLMFRLALRELRSGIGGFYVFIMCIALGVAVIATVGSLADALRNSFERQGATILGGDVTMSRPHTRVNAAERAWIDSLGPSSEVATVRAMARRTDGQDQALIEIKGIDARYPLVGTIKLSGGATLDQLRAGSDIAVEPILLERLGVKIGDKLQLGKSEHVVRATIETEPDKVAERLTVGPRILISAKALETTGFIDPGSLVTWRYAAILKDTSGSTAGLVSFRDKLRAALPEAGFTVRDRRDPAPAVSRTLERLREFLTLLGLTALMVGGVGVANAVSTYVDRRRGIIATFKSLGATSDVILGVHLIQVLLMTAIGIAIGLIGGTALTALVARAAGTALPIQADIGISLSGLLTAALYGFLVALVFILWPIGRAEKIRASVLFRDEVTNETVRPRRAIMFATAAAVVALFALAVFSSEAKRLAAAYCLAVAAVLVCFWLLGSGISWAARRIPRPRRPEIALALGDIAAPGGLARSVVLSLGTGLSLLVAVALVDRSIINELSGRIPATSPNYFMLDIKKSEIGAFEELVRKIQPDIEIHTAPMLRGRIVKVGDTLAENVKARPEQSWVLNGDRGLSYSETVPDGSTVVEGTWWAKDYAGPPLVSMEAEIARGLGLKIGDSLTINVLGRNVVAKIANLRDVKWESLALNFVLVFSPNTLAGAPHNVLATVTLPKTASLAKEAEIAREVGKAFPAVTAIRVKDAINQFNSIFERVMVAVRAAGSITLLSGALVLAGALATAQRRRIKQAVILKTLGATRRRILTTHLAEYGMLAFSTAFIAAILGSLAAWTTVARVMKLGFVFSPVALLEALAVAIILVGVFGGYGTSRILKARPVPHLRSE